MNVRIFFVETAFRDWKKALEKKIRKHQTKKYHKDAMEDVQNFKLVYENKKKNDVITVIDKGRKQQLENR